MDNQWNDSEAAGMNDLQLLAYASQLIGREPSLVLHGGGNSSYTPTETFSDPLLEGRTERVLYVKGSGSDMATIQPEQFSRVNVDLIPRPGELQKLPDDKMMRLLERARIDASVDARPSVETLLHAFLPGKYILHSHANAMVTLTNQPDADIPRILAEVYGEGTEWLPYVMPGFDLAEAVDKKKPMGNALVLAHHGLFTWGATAREAYDKHIEMVTKAEQYIAQKKAAKNIVFAPVVADQAKAAEAALIIRKHVSLDNTVNVRWDDDAETLAMISHPGFTGLSQRGVATPDHVIRTKQKPLVISLEGNMEEAIAESIAQYAADYEQYFLRNKSDSVTKLAAYPRVIIIPGLGLFTTGPNMKEVRIAADIYSHTVRTIYDAEAIGTYTPISEKDHFDMEYWILEQAKLSKTTKPIEGRTALVTGGAGMFAQEISRTLVKEGANVIITDVRDDAGLVLETELKQLGKGLVKYLHMDITNPEEVQRVFEIISRSTGGVDIVIATVGFLGENAKIENMNLELAQKSLEINGYGHLVVLQQAIRVMKQSVGGDIIYLSTNNVPLPGPEFGGYSMGKAAGHQINSVAAREAAGYGIRVNVVTPYDEPTSALWDPEIIAKRAAKYGTDAQGLKNVYLQRTLMKKEILPEHVAKTVFAVLTIHDRATGQTFRVDGGRPELKD